MRPTAQVAPATTVEQANGDAAGLQDPAEPQGLTATLAFDSGHSARPYSGIVRFRGRRIGVAGPPSRGDTFVHEEPVGAVIPDSGPISVTARIYGINAGEWDVSGELLAPPLEAGRPRVHMRAETVRECLRPASWSWRKWRLSYVEQRPLKTRWAPFAPFDRMPAVIVGSWMALVALGVLIGFLFQAWLLPRQHVAFGTVVPISLLAVVAGIVGGKAWYVALNLRTWRRALRDGFCIQGALVGATAVGIAAILWVRLPLGVVLDATTPGLLVGVAIGRLGCFFTGCCAGRPTASRFGVWSSDRRVGARRIPAQLFESLAALTIGLVALFVVLRSQLAVPGALFVAAMAAYTLCRQFVLRLRAERRRSAIAGPLTAIGAALVLSGSIAWLLVGGS
ncbi:MAG: prolipoprotein diacylglyceryl transferase [Candidatus Dormibacteria bacterium]